MTQGVVTYIRTALACAIGVGIDFILFAEAYPYNERFQHQKSRRHQRLLGRIAAGLGLRLRAQFQGARLGRKKSRSRGLASGSRFPRLPDPVGIADRADPIAHHRAGPGCDQRPDDLYPLAVRVHRRVARGGSSGLGRIDARTCDVLGGQTRPRAVRRWRREFGAIPMNWTWVFLGFRGRLSPKQFSRASSILVLGYAIVWVLSSMTGEGDKFENLACLAFCLATIWPVLAVCIKRLHDGERTVLLAIPVALIMAAHAGVVACGRQRRDRNPIALCGRYLVDHLGGLDCVC